MVSLGGLLGEIKRWLDGDEAAELAEEQPRTRREWEEFLIAVAREVEAAMQREMFTPPGGPIYIPPEYLVFLSPEDDAQWQGAKREGLERGLNYVLAQRVQELIGEQEVQTRSFAIELRVDGALEKGKFRIQPVWDIASPKTEIRPRRAPAPPAPPPVRTEDADSGQKDEEVADEATIVRPRAPLFTLEVTKGGGETETKKIHQPRITIGRGSKDLRVDLKLEGDLEISRQQAVIERLEAGRFALTCEGRNPIEVNGRELTQGERTEFAAGEVVRIGPYELKVPLE
jgi:hypothetical protein